MWTHNTPSLTRHPTFKANDTSHFYDRRGEYAATVLEAVADCSDTPALTTTSPLDPHPREVSSASSVLHDSLCPQTPVTATASPLPSRPSVRLP